MAGELPLTGRNLEQTHPPVEGESSCGGNRGGGKAKYKGKNRRIIHANNLLKTEVEVLSQLP